jgi:hypothetical protein
MTTCYTNIFEVASWNKNITYSLPLHLKNHPKLALTIQWSLVALPIKALPKPEWANITFWHQTWGFFNAISSSLLPFSFMPSIKKVNIHKDIVMPRENWGCQGTPAGVALYSEGTSHLLCLSTLALLFSATVPLILVRLWPKQLKLWIWRT